jgi:hypothetical protein
MQSTDVSLSETGVKKEAGSWRGYKLMLIIIIIALFVFIAMAKQDFFENLNKLFVLIGGGIAAISGALEVLSRQNKISGK